MSGICECSRCGARFRTIGQFDKHVLDDHDPRPRVRPRRRTSRVIFGPDTVELCDPECRDEFLLDLGIRGSGGGSAFPARGEAVSEIQWNSKAYLVSWRRQRPSGRYCDLCGDEWRFRAPVRRELSAETRAVLAERGRQLAARLHGPAGVDSAVPEDVVLGVQLLDAVCAPGRTEVSDPILAPRVGRISAEVLTARK